VKVLIVAKTRRGSGACVGGIAGDGRSVRLIAHDAATNADAGLEYEIGEVWEIDSIAEPEPIPPHVENIIVLHGRRLRTSNKLVETIRRFMPPVMGGPEKLFDGLTQATAAGGLHVTKRTGLPHCSTMFWVPDQSLRLDCDSKRLRYRYETSDGGRTLTFLGFQEPLPEIPAGALLRVSLAHWWRPPERPEEELRCFVQLSGWFVEPGADPHRSSEKVPEPALAGESAGVPNPAPASALEPRELEVLKRTFGFSRFLPLQADVIARVLQGQDSLVVMPTGGGKSLCYQLPALLFDGLTVVISPLVALMQDQVSQLSQLEVPAACLNHMVRLHEYTTIANLARHGLIRLLYVAPETLLRPETLMLLEQSRLTCLAIDEAHCISEWGHDFRPEYRQLQNVRRRFPQAVCLALTATAAPRVREDIRRLLGIPAEGEFVASFNRQNLFISVEPRHDGLAQVIAFLEQRRGQSGIIYCGTRKQTDELCEGLNANGWPALPYHAGLDDAVRRRNQEQFIQDEAQLMVATVAFGMGINKANVRFVIHAHLPKALENYYQEIGRAGRDGLPAECLLLYSRADVMLHRHFIDQGAASERPGRAARLQALMRFVETRDCRRVPLLAYFGERLEQPCGGCDNCGQDAVTGAMTDVTEPAEKFLTCVKLTGQLFGPAHIISVLRGSQAERVLAKGHDRLSCYGTGKDHSAEEWRELSQQFIRSGVLDQDFEFGGLRLTPKGWEVLRGKEKVHVRLEPMRLSEAPKRSAEPYDQGLFEQLRDLRRELASQAALPAYMIFSDRALLEMATFFPQNEEEFLKINGVGEVKLAKYGATFLKDIRDYGPRRTLVQDASPEIVRPVARRRYHEIGEFFANGRSIDELAQRYSVVRATVIHNLYRFHASGGVVDPDRVLSASGLGEGERERVLGAFGRLGTAQLAPVREALACAVSYEELHLLRLYFLCRQRS
jgi:ATP-dependent DNA helicase RecQ